MSSRSVIDLVRHPIDRLEALDGRTLVASVRQQLETSGCALLRDFIEPHALHEMQHLARDLACRAHFNHIRTNPYSCNDDPSLPIDHPRRTFMERTNGFVAGDLISAGAAIRLLYHNVQFQRFIAACVGAPALCEYADPLAGLVINVLRPGCQHPWHFDNNDFIVTLMTQPAAKGGIFEYCPGIRSANNENYAAVAAVLGGDDREVRRLNIRPGDLQIFHGRNALHRVTTVEGQQERYTIILAYANRPDLIADADRTERLFGRVSPAHVKAAGEARFVKAVNSMDDAT